jgi:hypothetical protein
VCRGAPRVEYIWVTTRGKTSARGKKRVRMRARDEGCRERAWEGWGGRWKGLRVRMRGVDITSFQREEGAVKRRACRLGRGRSENPQEDNKRRSRGLHAIPFNQPFHILPPNFTEVDFAIVWQPRFPRWYTRHACMRQRKVLPPSIISSLAPYHFHSP